MTNGHLSFPEVKTVQTDIFFILLRTSIYHVTWQTLFFLCKRPTNIMFYEKTKYDISEIKILIFIVFGMFIAC